MMQAKAFSKKSAMFYRTSRSQIPQLAGLFKSFFRNYCTIFCKESTCPQPQDVASTSRRMHPVLFTVYIQSTCILYILTCDLINCKPTNAVLFDSFPEYISATFYTNPAILLHRVSCNVNIPTTAYHYCFCVTVV